MNRQNNQIPVAVVGTGNVGSALLRLLIGRPDLRVVAVSNVNRTAVSWSGGYSRSKLLAVAQDGDPAHLGKFVRSGAECLGPHLAAKVQNQPVIIVDVSAADFAQQHLLWHRSGFCLVTANKKPLTDSQDTWCELISGGLNQYRFECTCGAGLPVISTLQDLLATGDRISEIRAMASGTLGYVLSECSTGQDFAEVVLQAKQQGFTEPDPRDDLAGTDVARKALIMARLIGHELELADLPIESLVPEALRDCDLAEFLHRLPDESVKFNRRMHAVRQRGFVLRYLAVIGRQQVTVGLREVAPDSAFGRLDGPDNMFLIRTDRYDQPPLIIRGPGAGAEVTAAGVLADILRIAATL